MFGRHKHDWRKVAERFNPPAATPTRLRNIDEDTLERLVYGFTVVTFQCAECPEVRFTRVTGRSAGAIVGESATTPREGRLVTHPRDVELLENLRRMTRD